MSFWRMTGLALLALTGFAGAAQAQCPSGAAASEPLYRSGLELNEATSLDATAGGPLDLGECEDLPGAGYISDAPSLSLAFTRDEPRDLRIRVRSDCDSTLLINDVNRNWHFDDDTNTTDPEVWIENAPSGRLDIWVGSISNETCAAAVELETFEEGTRAGMSGGSDASCPSVDNPGLTLDLTGDELRSGRALTLKAGGVIPLSGCGAFEGLGYVRSRPDYSINFERTDAFDIRFEATSACDTAMVVNDYYENWHYSDDVEGHNPALWIRNPESGRIDVWLGTLAEAECDATLTLTTHPAENPDVIGGGGSESVPREACFGAETAGEPLDFASADLYTPGVFPALAGGSVDLERCQEVTGIGHVEAQPDYSLNLTQSGGHDIRIRASGTCDLVLVSNDYHRNWQYSDDANGRDPEIIIFDPPTGRIDLWVGAIGVETCKAKIEVESF